MFKFLKRLFIFTFVVVVVAAAWLRNSPYWTLVEVHHGIEGKDLGRVERVVDLERFVASSTAVLGTLLAEEFGAGGTDPGGRALGALAGLVSRGVGELVAKDGAKAFRQAVVEGRVERQIGPLQVNDGLRAVGSMANTIDGAVVEVNGTCNGAPASVWLQMERRDDGPFGGLPRRWVVVGVDPESVKTLAAICRASSSSAAADKT